MRSARQKIRAGNAFFLSGSISSGAGPASGGGAARRVRGGTTHGTAGAKAEGELEAEDAARQLRGMASPGERKAQGGSPPTSHRDALPTYDLATDREALHAFFSRVNPEKLGSIDVILQRFEGNEDKMYLALSKMYPGERLERPAT